MKVIPNYHPPSDYRRPTKTQEKVYVPVNDYPEINFSMIANPQISFIIVLPLCNALGQLPLPTKGLLSLSLTTLT
jgi:splicing factor 1